MTLITLNEHYWWMHRLHWLFHRTNEHIMNKQKWTSSGEHNHNVSNNLHQSEEQKIILRPRGQHTRLRLVLCETETETTYGTLVLCIIVTNPTDRLSLSPAQTCNNQTFHGHTMATIWLFSTQNMAIASCNPPCPALSVFSRELRHQIQLLPHNPGFSHVLTN